jgi:hypothetical protein
MAQSRACHVAILCAASLRNPNRDREGKTETEDKRKIEDIVGKGRSGQRKNTEPTDHEGIGKRNQHLAELPGGERHREGCGFPTRACDIVQPMVLSNE